MSQNVSHKRDFKQPRHDLYTSSSHLSVEYLVSPVLLICTVPSLSVNLSLQIREGQRVGAFYVWLSRGAGVQGCRGAAAHLMPSRAAFDFNPFDSGWQQVIPFCSFNLHTLNSY